MGFLSIMIKYLIATIYATFKLINNFKSFSKKFEFCTNGVTLKSSLYQWAFLLPYIKEKEKCN